MNTSPTQRISPSEIGAFWPGIRRVLEGHQLNASGVGTYMGSDESYGLASRLREQYKLDDDVEVVDGAGQGVFLALVVSRRFADRVILPRIGFPGYIAFASALGYQVGFYDPISLSCESSAVSSCFSATRRSVVIISQPHNPTGHVYSSQEIRKLVRSCAGHEPVLVIDFGADFCGEILSNDPALDLGDTGARTVVCVASLGKLLGCPGLRLGFVWSCDRETMKDIAEFKVHVSRSPCPLAASLAIRLLDTTDYMREVELARSEISLRRAWLFDALRHAGVAFVRPDAGCFIYADDGGALSFAGAAGVRGHVFGDPSATTVRLTTALHEVHWQQFRGQVHALGST